MLENKDTTFRLLLVLFLLSMFALAANLLWVLWKYLNREWCKRSADYIQFYRVCHMRYGIIDSKSLTTEENQRHAQEVAQGYERFSHCSIEQLGRILDRQRPKYEALRRN